MKKVLIFIAISFMAISLMNCANEKKENKNELVLLAAASMSNPLSPQQQKAITVGSSVAGSVSSSVPYARTTMASNAASEQQRLVAGIIDNGYDPVYSSEAFKGYLSINSITSTHPEVKLASITMGSETGTTGNKTYTFSGTIDGIGKKEISHDITNPLIGPCSISIISPDITQKVGACSFASGSTIAWSGSFDGSSNYSGNSTLDATMTYAGFGTWYYDWFTILYNVKHHPTIPSLTCAGFQAMYQNYIANLHKYCIIDSGTLNAHMVTSYNTSYVSDIGSIASNMDFAVTLNSPDGITIKDNGEGPAKTITLADVLYHYSCNFSYNPETPASIPTGSLALTFSGKVDGVDIDESISLSFP